MQWFKVRASSAAPLFLNEDGLTEAQQKLYDDLTERKISDDPKKKLTPNMEVTLADLQSKLDALSKIDNGEYEDVKDLVEDYLPTGAKSLIEGIVDKYVYKYRDTLDNKELDKGKEVEDDAIDYYNNVFFLDRKKSESSLAFGIMTGHPDIEDEDEGLIEDVKCPWSKKTFPKLPEDGKSSTYEWQGKTYLWMKKKMTGDNKWTKFRLVYILMDTPEHLIPEWEDDSLHNMSDLEDNQRFTRIDYTLTPQDEIKMERRQRAAVVYAELYYNKLINKNK